VIPNIYRKKNNKPIWLIYHEQTVLLRQWSSGFCNTEHYFQGLANLIIWDVDKGFLPTLCVISVQNYAQISVKISYFVLFLIPCLAMQAEECNFWGGGLL
jgi:hypothetical protein